VPYFPAEFKVYPEVLGEHGYFCGKTGKGWAPGVAKDVAGKNRQLTGQPFDKRTAPPPASGIGRNDYAGNFADFLAAAPAGMPWCFWYGAIEPHRDYEYGSGVAKGGKKTEDIKQVPGCWPDNEVVRNDLLDYAFEVEHFDRHLGRMIEQLEKRGELAQTLVVVTSDNGMPFPRAKGNQYEYSSHMPLAIMWTAGIKGRGRRVDDYVSFIDLAPTFIEVAGLAWDKIGLAPTPGKSLGNIFAANATGWVDQQRDLVLIGQERHDVGRPNDWGYPIRGILKRDLLYLQNFEPDRWPACNPETGYLNCDGGPTKTEILKARRNPVTKTYWDFCFGKRPTEELYDLSKDPACLNNLAGHTDFERQKSNLKEQLFSRLKAQEDPRMFGQGKLFDDYPYADERYRNFYERFKKLEKLNPGWVNPSDFEKEPVE
jgi:hypothetical protein